MSTIGRLGRHTKENYLEPVGKCEPVQEGTKKHRLPSEEPQTVAPEYISFIQILITKGNKFRLSSSAFIPCQYKFAARVKCKIKRNFLL